MRSWISAEDGSVKICAFVLGSIIGAVQINSLFGDQRATQTHVRTLKKVIDLRGGIPPMFGKPYNSSAILSSIFGVQLPRL